jgi:RHS repeat-associated protein
MGYVCRIDEGANGEILARDYFVYDGLGSCRALVSSSGVVVAKYDYDVYGSIRGQEGQRANSFKYVAQIGHPTDEETGLIYMRARYYDPEIGRFITEDPAREYDNWYFYGNANPVNYIDIHGFDIIGYVEGIKLEADAAIAAEAAKDLAFKTLLEAWTKWVLKTFIYGIQSFGPGIYTIESGIGTWIFRIVLGRDPYGTAYAIQVWLENNEKTRFMAIFAAGRGGSIYNIDIKCFDARFVWWVQQLLQSF